MFLLIHDQLTVADLEERFEECFPFLKIAFYSRPHGKFEGTEKEFRYPGWQRLCSIRKKHRNQPYEIKSWFTVARVEKDLKELYGLNAQIFRCDKEGNAVQTTLSDGLTLKQQSDLINGIPQPLE